MRLLSALGDWLGLPPAGGFVWAAGDDPLAGATPRQVIRNPDDGPPWIVVAHRPEAVVPTRWPGRLWRATILRTAADQPVRGTGYTRASAVRIEEEVPAARIFGPGGEGVVRVLDAADSLDPARVRALAAARHPAAGEAYARCWERWPGTAAGEGIDHRSTLSAGPERSPVGPGLSLLYSVVSQRARALVGEAAFDRDDEDVWLTGEWGDAVAALLETMMALGAPAAVPDRDREVLLAAWRGAGPGA